MENINNYDVIIVGGGAAGLFAAINIKRNRKNTKVAILEQLDRVGKKLIVTGNGRCNITNKNIELNRYHGENIGFCNNILQNFGVYDTQSFFETLGLLITFEDNGKAFPLSYQASSVVDVLRFECDRLGIETVLNCTVTDYEKLNNGYKVITNNEMFVCKYLVIAAGLFSGGEKLGSNGKMFRIMRSKGFKTVNTTPAIVQLKTETDIVKVLKGIKVNAFVSLKSGGKVLRKEYGEILFTEYGISGPPVLQISGEAAKCKGEKTAVIDLMPDYGFSELNNLLADRRKMFALRKAEFFFTGMFNRILGQTLLKTSGIKLSDNCVDITDNKLKELTDKIKNFTFKIIGDNGFVNSQVTSGGLDTNEFIDSTLESKKHKGLFAIGEILDVYGDCGGFNLQWAWASAFAASTEICGRLSNDTN